MRVPFLAVCLSACFGLISIVSAQEPLRVVGSDLLEGILSEPLAEFSEQAEMPFSVELEGSYLGLAELRKGQADLVIAAVPGEIGGLSESYELVPLAYQVAVVLVNVENPLSEISLPRLQGIFGRQESQNLNQWNELGLSTWQARGIKPVSIQSPEDGIALDLFRFTVLSSPELKRSVSLFLEKEKLVNYIQRDNSAIGLASFVPEVPELKILRVANSATSTAFGPEPAAVHSGDYPLRLPFYLIFEAGSEERLRELMGFLFSSEVTELLEESNLVPLPKDARQRRLMNIELG